MVFYTLPTRTAASTCSTWNAMAMTCGSIRTMITLITSGMATTGSCLSSPATLFVFTTSSVVFCYNDLIHPPSIFPTSCNFSEILMYFLFSRHFTSQATCRKNLSKSNATEALLRKISFSALLEYPAFIIFSKTSKNKASIFPPSVYFERFGKSGRYSTCHSL